MPPTKPSKKATSVGKKAASGNPPPVNKPPPVREEEEESEPEAQAQVLSPGPGRAEDDDDADMYVSTTEEEQDEEGGEEDKDEEEEDEGEGEEEEEEVVVPRKRKPATAAKPKKKKKTTKRSNKDDEPAPKMIGCSIQAYTIAEMQKNPRQRQVQARHAELSSALEWEDFRDQVKIKIADVLFPAAVSVPNAAFAMTFSIRSHVPAPIPLRSEADYKTLLAIAAKMKSPAVKIIVEQKATVAHEAPDKENTVMVAAPAPAPAAGGGNAQAKKKTKARTEADILPGNVAKNENIRSLRERWACNTNTCHSEYCYVPAEGPHFWLSHELFDKWAAAMLHRDGGVSTATLEHPPNIREFDAVSTHTIVSKSKILQERVNAMSKERGGNAPVINVVLPNNPYALYPGAPGAPPVVPVVPPPVAPNVDAALLPTALPEGPRLDIETFCAVYFLSAELLQRFKEHRVTGTHAFTHIAAPDLKDMGFKIGEIIDIKEAILSWSSGKSL